MKGYFRKGVRRFPFTKEIEAPSEKLAREYIYSILGSLHKVKRAQVHIEEVRASQQ